MSVKRISLFTQSKSGEALTQSKKSGDTPHKKFTPHKKNSLLTKKNHSSYTTFCFVPGNCFDGLETFYDKTRQHVLRRASFCKKISLENKNGEALTQSNKNGEALKWRSINTVKQKVEKH
jgi:hypothetical protein